MLALAVRTFKKWIPENDKFFNTSTCLVYEKVYRGCLQSLHTVQGQAGLQVADILVKLLLKAPGTSVHRPLKRRGLAVMVRE